LVSIAENMTSTTDRDRDEKKVSQIGNGVGDTNGNSDGALDNIMMPDAIIPQIGTRNIIVAPIHCPKGQRQDNKGRCRDIL